MKRRRGVSPIVAAVLLTAIVIVLGVSVFLWSTYSLTVYGGGINTFYKLREEQLQEDIVIEHVQFIDGNNLTIYVRNIGSIDTRLKTIYIVNLDNTSQHAVISIGGDGYYLGVGELGNISITIPGWKWIVNDAYKIKVTTFRGVGRSITLVLSRITRVMKTYITTIVTSKDPDVTYGNVNGLYTGTWYYNDNKWQNITESSIYRRPITIDNTGSSYSLTDYQIKVTLTTSNFDYSKAKSDGSDIRFTDSDGVTILDYWIEKWNTSGTSILWVKVPNIPASSTKTIYMYYGNPTASYDVNHYGLTKVMEPLPANDGPGYKIYYEVWNMPNQLFNSNEGVAEGWHADDHTWALDLPFSFPYYSDSYSPVHVCSNGFVKATDDYHEDHSTVNRLKEKDMMAPFWAALDTKGDSRDIYVNSSYTDQYGNGVYIRWYTTFDKGNGEQNFAIVLYENGLIRFDYGTINGTFGQDITPVIGVSKGDNSHYTLITTNDYELPSNWNDHNSIMFWPRKKADIEPSVTVGNEETRYIMDVYYTFNIGNISISSIRNIVYKFYGHTSNETIHIAIYNFTASEWFHIGDITSTNNNWVNITLPSDFQDLINASGSLLIRYYTDYDSTGPDTLYIDYQCIQITYVEYV